MIEEILSTAETEGYSPQETAKAVRAWRDDTANEIRATAETPSDYFKAASALDADVNEGLGRLRQRAATSWIKSEFTNSADAASFIDSLVMGSEPQEEAPKLEFQNRLMRMKEASALPDLAPLRAEEAEQPLALPDGRRLGAFTPRKRADGGLDVLLNLDTEEDGKRGVAQRMIDVPAVTDEELAAEAERIKKKINAAERYQGTRPGPELQQMYEQQRGLTKESMLAQRVAEKVKSDPELTKLVGKSGASELWEEAVKGFAGAVLPMLTAGADVLGDEQARDEFRALSARLPEIFEGDTRRAFTRDPNAIIPDLAEVSGTLGGIMPQVAMGLVPGAGPTLAAASMGATGYGAGLDEALSRADQTEQQAMAFPEGSEQRANLLAEAQRVRDTARNVAAGKALSEVVSERILPEEIMGAVSGASRLGRFARTVAGSGVEGAAAELGSQLVGAAAYGDGIDLGQVAKGAILEAAGGVGFGAMQAAAGEGAAASGTVRQLPDGTAQAQPSPSEGASDEDFAEVERGMDSAPIDPALKAPAPTVVPVEETAVDAAEVSGETGQPDLSTSEGAERNRAVIQQAAALLAGTARGNAVPGVFSGQGAAPAATPAAVSSAGVTAPMLPSGAEAPAVQPVAAEAATVPADAGSSPATSAISETGQSPVVQAPAVSDTAKAELKLNAMVAELPEASRKVLTPQVMASAQAYFAGDETALQGMTKIQARKVREARLQSDIDALNAANAADAAQEQRMRQLEAEEEAWLKSTTDKTVQKGVPSTAGRGKVAKGVQYATYRLNQMEMGRLALPDKAGRPKDTAKSLKSTLTIIANDYNYPPLMRQVARMLMRSALGKLTLIVEDLPDAHYAGMYEPSTGVVRLNLSAKGAGASMGQNMGQTLLHELLHHTSYQLIEGNRGTAEQRAAAKAIRDLLPNLRKAAKGKFQNALSNPHEFVSEIMTDPAFQEWLRQQPAPGKQKGIRHMLDYIFLKIAEMVSGRKVEGDSALAEGIRLSLTLVELEDGSVAPISLLESEVAPLESEVAPLASPNAMGKGLGALFPKQAGAVPSAPVVRGGGLFGSRPQAAAPAVGAAVETTAASRSYNERRAEVVAAIRQEARRDMLVPAPALMKKLGVSQADSKALLLELHNEGVVYLSPHDRPGNLSAEDKAYLPSAGGGVGFYVTPMDNGALMSPNVFSREENESRQGMLREDYYKLTGRRLVPSVYDVFRDPDMVRRAVSMIQMNGFSNVLRAMASSQGQAALGVDDVLATYLKAELVEEAKARLAKATNEVDEILAAADLRRAMDLWQAQASSGGQLLAAVRYAGVNLRDPVTAVVDAIDKGQQQYVEPVMPGEQTAGVLGALADLAGDEATARLVEQVDDESFEQRLIPILQGLQPMPKMSMKSAVAKLLGKQAGFREEAIKDAADAVEKAFMQGQRPAAEKGALRTLLNNMNSILKSKLPKAEAKDQQLSYEDSIARAFLDAETERALFQQSWQKARAQLLAKVAEAGPSPLTAELDAILPASPTLWFNPAATTKLFKDSIAMLQGLDAARMQDVLINPDRMKAAVMKLITDRAAAAGMDSVKLPRVQDQMSKAWNEWIANAKGEALMREGMAAIMRKGKLLTPVKTAQAVKGKPKQSQAGVTLPDLIRSLLPKVAGAGITWADVFTSSARDQKAWEMEIYSRIRKHRDLQNLSLDEIKLLTREASKVWQAERRKVWNRELEKYTERLKPKAAKVLKDKAPKLMKLINLNALDAATFRDAVADAFGIKSLTSGEVAEVKRLAEEMQKLPNGVKRRMLQQQIISKLQDVSRLSRAQLIGSYWTASVLSGPATIVDITLSILNGMQMMAFTPLVTALRTGEVKLSAQAWVEFWKRMPSAVMESIVHLRTGDKSFMRRADDEVQKLMEKGGKGFTDAVRQLQQGKLYPVGWGMEMLGRIMTALDHAVTQTTAAGARNLLLAHNPELAKLATTVTQQDRDNARRAARDELTGGVKPATLQEKVREDARVRELLIEMVPDEMLLTAEKQAEQLGLDVSGQGEVGGALGLGYTVLQNAFAQMEKATAELVPTARQWGGVRSAVAVPTAQALHAAAQLGQVMSGLRFIRSALNLTNYSLTFVPGVGLLRSFEEGMLKNPARMDALLGSQVMGLSIVGATLGYLLSTEEDEWAWKLEGSHANLTPQQKSNLMAQNIRPYTLHYKDKNGKVHMWEYKQWPISMLLAAVGSMMEARKYKGQDIGQSLLTAVASGIISVKDKSQLTGFAQLIGSSPYSVSDPGASFVEGMNKYAAGLAGGMVPAFLKDIDYMVQPDLGAKPETMLQQWAAQIPMMRTLNGKRVNLFGQDIQLNRYPLRRIYQVGTEGEAYRILASLNERGVYLTDPTAGSVKIRNPNGTTAEMSGEALNRYQREAGALYQDWVLNVVPTLLANTPRTPAGDAALKDVVEKFTERLRKQAKLQAQSRVR